MSSDALHRFPDRIELDRAEYRHQMAALEASLAVLDEHPAADPTGTRRSLYDASMRTLMYKIWPALGGLDRED